MHCVGIVLLVYCGTILTQMMADELNFIGNRKQWRRTGSRQSTPYQRYGPDHTNIQYRPLKLHGFP